MNFDKSETYASLCSKRVNHSDQCFTLIISFLNQYYLFSSLHVSRVRLGKPESHDSFWPLLRVMHF